MLARFSRVWSQASSAVRNEKDRVVAVLQALNKHDGTFTPEDEATMARYCAEALKLIE